MITTDTAAPKGNNRMNRNKMTSTVTFRLDLSLKEGLWGLAEKQGRSLSSLIQNSLQDLLDSYKGGSGPARLAQEEKRQHLRREILLPARWKVSKGNGVLEHDVLLKNISVGGAYTEYVRGQNFKLIENLLASPLALVFRMPKSQEPVVVECRVSRINITDSFVGVGLHFISKETDLIL